VILLILGLILFLGAHLVPTQPATRDSLIAKYGDTGYKIAFHVASVAGFVLIVWGMASARGSALDPHLWTPPVWTRHLALVLMLPAFILLAAAYIPSRIRDVAKHPMLASIKIWALAHLIANGDLAGLLLFGSFLAYGVYDRISVKKRGALGPLGARHGAPNNDLIAVGVGTAAYLLTLFVVHPYVFGISVLP
jgi:uncharacterized membrane protein